jgi:hypothetical protein
MTALFPRSQGQHFVLSIKLGMMVAVVKILIFWSSMSVWS